MTSVYIKKNISLKDIPPTPPSPNDLSVQVNYIFDILIQQGFEYGIPVGYAQEQNGSLIQNILPVYKLEKEQISSSSKTLLGLHTETAFHPYKPDYILLLCLRGDPLAATTYAEIDDILLHVPKKYLNILKQKWFITGVDISFRTNGEQDVEIPISIIKENEKDGLSFVYDETVIKPINSDAADALSALRKAVSLATKEIVLKTGDLLFINNHKAVHGRKPFKARYDGTDRWLQRLLIRKTLPPKKFLLNNNIINVELKDMVNQ
jgi:L-asparagine oxygenase